MATTTRKTAQPAAKKATAPAAPKVKKSDQREEDRDFTYLADKMPTDLHEDMAKFILEKTGLEVEDEAAFVKAVQLTAVMRMVYQRSDANKARATYRALDEAVVEQRSLHMVQAHTDANTEIAARKARDEAKANERKAKAAAARKSRAAKKTAAPAPVQEEAAAS